MKFLQVAVLLTLSYSFGFAQNIVRTAIIGPPGTSTYGEKIVVLPNGNVVVWDKDFRPPSLNRSTGAVHLYDGGSFSLISTLHGAASSDDIGSGGITVLANGNFVVGSPSWGKEDDLYKGAVTFCHAETGCSGPVTRANSVVGNTILDSLGGKWGVFPLVNGNFVISGPDMDTNGVINAGAVLLCDGENGCPVGDFPTASAIVGTGEGDRIGLYCDSGCDGGIIPLSNGNFVIMSPHWNGNRGAVTLASGTSQTPGSISAANSLVGTEPGEQIGRGERMEVGVHALPSGNYVVSSSGWNSARGASTFCDGFNGCIGNISAKNSLVGTNAGDEVASLGTTVLESGHYVVVSPRWNGQRGAATFGSQVTGVSGAVSAMNSLVGQQALDSVSSGRVVPLPSGSYLVVSPLWANIKGAVSWCTALGGCSGFVSASNSLVGSHMNDKVGSNGVTVLSDGDYVVHSPDWQSEELFSLVGAATWGDGQNGTTGPVSSANSIRGQIGNDRVGLGSAALADGKYAVLSWEWDNGGVTNVGAVTFCGSSEGCAAVVDGSNSLIGSQPGDLVGNGRIKTLATGNFVIVSEEWNDDRGAVSFGNGISGIVGTVGPHNSLVGAAVNDRVGNGDVYPLENGDYIVSSYRWNDYTGAATYGTGNTGVAGLISPSNSLVGNESGDRVGWGTRPANLFPRIDTFENGGYVIGNGAFRVGGNIQAGAATFSFFGDFVKGTIDQTNSIFGPYANSGNKFTITYNPVHNKIIIANTDADRLYLIGAVSANPRYDFDGDGRADVSVFRPNPGSLIGGAFPEGGASQWWILKSSDLGGQGMTFGQSTDRPAPADFTGDGKTDVAFFRPSNGTWYVLRSEDQSFFAFPFGVSGDVPAPGDFDGDGKADPAVFRPSEGTWYILRSSDSGLTVVPFGVSEDIPQIADFDGDGKDDISLFRRSSGQWWQLRSTEGVKGYQFGEAQDFPVAGDYTGDGKADVAFFRQATFSWNIVRSEDDSYYAFPWGFWSDIPVPADYDGDGVVDPAVFRPENNIWYIYRTSNGPQFVPFGSPGDVLLPGYSRHP